ncbi:DUF2283 domain-containing protein [Candidatus Pacearchaeota archaeon]|nr:DUF2283 domain-containing protein [Candidatus Pacearchaeota archaeon]
MNEYKFHYDSEDDVLYIQNAVKDVEESIEFSEDIVLDLDRRGNVIGVEIFYASEFFGLFNKEIDKEFLEGLQEAYIEHKDFRNVWFIVLVLQSKNKQIYQPLPPLKKSEYISPVVQYFQISGALN